jgi:hypothetical protein
MKQRTRREFLRQVGAGVIGAGIGSALAADLGLAPCHALQEGGGRLTFGALEPLVALQQETPVAKLQPLLVGLHREGKASLKDLVGAAALANARTFGGGDYVGFHAMFAFLPAYAIAQELPRERQLLPVLKALYRNTARIQEFGGPAKEILRPVAPAAGPALRDAVRRMELKGAEETLAGLCKASAADAFNQVQSALHDSTEVHRVNLVYRAWGLLDLVGQEHAHTLLRQSLRYFVNAEGSKQRDHFSGARSLLPKLIDEHRLAGKTPGTRVPDDAWVGRTVTELFAMPPERAAEFAAASLAEGVAPDAIHEAIALAANQMVLRDENKQAHGSTNGVHCCDAVNAWRNIGRVSEPANAVAGAILAAYHFAFDRDNPKRNRFFEWEPYPRREALEALAVREPDALLRELDGAVRNKDQARAAACVHRLGELGAPAAPVLELFRGWVLSQHGSLHGEKYFRTVCEEFAATRAPYRWRQLVGMARYAASMYGEPSPGYDEAVRLLGLDTK